MVGKRKKTESVIVHSVPCIVEMYRMQHDVPGEECSGWCVQPTIARIRIVMKFI